jgi:hypothetical protein
MKSNQLDALLLVVYVLIDDLCQDLYPDPPAHRPAMITDAEIITLSIAQALLDIPTERRFFRIAHARLGHLFSQLPERSVYNKRLRNLTPLMRITHQAMRSLQGLSQVERGLIDSTAISLAASKLTTKRSAFRSIASAIGPQVRLTWYGACVYT